MRLVREGVELPTGVARLPLVAGGLADLTQTVADQDCLVRQVEKIVEGGVLCRHLSREDLTAGLPSH